MKLAVDVHYTPQKAFVAGVLFTDWQSCKPKRELFAEVLTVANYESGQFYKRELPCILKLLEQVKPLPKYIVIDGYVYLGGDEKPGLGKYLYNTLQGQCVIIGVAKNRFQGTSIKAELLRGNSRRPLYVTAAGISQIEAKQFIKIMCGPSRFPILLKKVDHLCRGKA